MNRRMIVLANNAGTWTVFKQVQTGLGYWNDQSTSVWPAFPFHLVENYPSGYPVHVRSM